LSISNSFTRSARRGMRRRCFIRRPLVAFSVKIPPVHFLREFLTTPAVIGAVVPSSEYLARTMLAGLDLRNARAVLEYGPGSGIVTDHLRRESSPHTSLVAAQMKPRTAALCKQGHSDVR